MITQELRDFVKSQLADGSTREKITSDLLTVGGWTLEQINEAFDSLSKPQSAHFVAAGEHSDFWKSIKKGNQSALKIGCWLFFISVVFATGGHFITGFYSLLNAELIGPFAWMMIGVLMIFWFFVWLENVFLFEKYAHTKSKLDKPMEIIIRLRNLIFILNLIPFVQILGIWALFFGGLPMLFVYSYCMVRRNKSAIAI